MARTPSLTPREIHLWEIWQMLCDSIVASVERDVRQASGLSGAEHLVLSRLIDLGKGVMRQRELATALSWEKSRISHQLDRMQERGLLTREKTLEKGSRIRATALGRTAISLASPVYARAVRRYLLGRLTPEQATAIVSLAAGLRPFAEEPSVR